MNVGSDLAILLRCILPSSITFQSIDSVLQCYFFGLTRACHALGKYCKWMSTGDMFKTQVYIMVFQFWTSHTNGLLGLYTGLLSFGRKEKSR